MLRDILLGTWNYKVKEALFGFRTGKAIFFEADGELQAKLKIYGLTIQTKNLVIDGFKVAFNAQVDIEQVAIRLELAGDRLTGLVHMSEGTMAVEMDKKGSQPGRKTKVGAAGVAEKVGLQNLANRRKPLKALCQQVDLAEKAHTFYYGWYGNPEFDGKYIGWNSAIFTHWIDPTWNEVPPYPGGEDLAANFYPLLGAYSTSDPAVIDAHMRQIQAAGIGVVALSWWGNEHFTDQSVQPILEAAHSYGLKVVFHLEPFYTTVEAFRAQLAYICERYIQHPAIYRLNGLPLYYLYNSFKLDYRQWLEMMNPESATTLRNTPLDGVFISLWTTQFDGEFTLRSGFDGFYTYFAADGFSYGSTASNWPQMARFAQENNLIYIPCVGPGYIDTRIRPWNEATTRSRDQGRYFEAMMKNAANTRPDFIGITSFNEWFEGTQIEPAVPKIIPTYTYENYGDDVDPLFYIHKTRELINKYLENRR